MRTRCALLLPILLAGLVQAGAAQDLPREAPAQRDARMAWWREARFGMFIHWGPYAVPAGTYRGQRIAGIGEWIMQRAAIPIPEYEQFARQFNPTKFDAEEWVRLAKEAGMKYIIITSKHHDGFAIFDSKVSDYDIVDFTPFRRDPLKELAEAARRHGLKLGFYYSIMDWHHPDAQAPNYPNYNDGRKTNPNFKRYVEEYMKPQLRELLTNYGEVAVLWFDGEWIPDWTEEQGRDLYAFVRRLQPNILINNRVGKGRQGMQGLTKEGHIGDFGTPEQEVPPQGLPGVDWESCMTMNDTWGYKSFDDNWKDTRTLIRILIDAASKGGNFLLNVGPTAEGVIPAPSVHRLREIGEWMKVNGEAIYGTSASPFAEQPSWGRFTRKPGKLYAHVFDWPRDRRLEIPGGLREEVVRAYLLADEKRESLPVERTETGVVVTLPAVPPSTIASVVVLETRPETAAR
ncbi:MAG TPA: alpha-L-fucosidase [Longimicrobiales bacterium]